MSPSQSFQAAAWRRLKKNKGAVFGLLLIALALIVAVFAYFLAPNHLYLPSSLAIYERVKGEEDYYGIYYRWIPYCFYKKIEFRGKTAVAGASKWKTHCENGVCKLIRCDDNPSSRSDQKLLRRPRGPDMP